MLLTGGQLVRRRHPDLAAEERYSAASTVPRNLSAATQRVSSNPVSFSLASDFATIVPPWIDVHAEIDVRFRILLSSFAKQAEIRCLNAHTMITAPTIMTAGLNM